MSGIFRWGNFSQLLSADIIDEENLATSRSGPYEFTSKGLTTAEGEGTLAFVRTPDYAVLIANCAFHEDRHYSVCDDGLVRFHFNFDVSIETSANDTSVAEIVDHSAGVLRVPPDQMIADHIPRGKRQHFVTIACKPRWLTDFFNVNLFDHFGQGDLDGTPYFYQQLPFTQPLRTTINTIAAQPVAGLGGPRIAALAPQALLLSLESMVEDQQIRPARLSNADIATIVQARDILIDHLAAPPGMQKLCRQVGINRTKLQYGFRDLFGLTITQFIEKKRMERAHALLLETDMSVSAIALELGYEHPSSFSTRFRHYFGRPPRLVRAQR